MIRLQCKLLTLFHLYSMFSCFYRFTFYDCWSYIYSLKIESDTILQVNFSYRYYRVQWTLPSQASPFCPVRTLSNIDSFRTDTNPIKYKPCHLNQNSKNRYRAYCRTVVETPKGLIFFKWLFLLYMITSHQINLCKI